MLIGKLIDIGNKHYYRKNTFTYYMYRMAIEAEKDGFSKEIIVACFLFRLGYLLDINSNLYCSYSMNYDENTVLFLNKINFNSKVTNIVGNYIKIKRFLGCNNREINRRYDNIIVNNGGNMKNTEFDNYKKKIDLGLLELIQYYEDIAIDSEIVLDIDINSKSNRFLNLCNSI